MRRILISINPEHVKNIIDGSKRFEYRTRVAKKDIDSIVVYSTYPEMKIVAEVEIDGILCMTPEKLWEKTKEYSGITKAFFDEYFKNREIAYAYELGIVKVYDEPFGLIDFGIKTAPQSYMYL